jgi:hypothetical protein
VAADSDGEFRWQYLATKGKDKLDELLLKYL